MKIAPAAVRPFPQDLAAEKPQRGAGKGRAAKTARLEAAAEDGFRSPATDNAVRKYTDRVLGDLDGETRASAEEAIQALVDLARQLSAGDDRPYGLSVEKQLKQLFNKAAIKDVLVGDVEPEPPVSPVSPQDPVAVEPPESGALPTASVPAAGSSLDVSA